VSTLGDFGWLMGNLRVYPVTLKIQRLSPDATIPEYAHGPDEDAGMDLRCTADALLQPNVPQAVPTGLAIELPPGYEAQIRPRSGLALKYAITLPNAPATIDPGYRGELKVILLNLGREPYQVHKGDKIAQIVIARYEAVRWEEAALADSARGANGFGSSGR
jgi:dUTP pyrophosphatase